MAAYPYLEARCLSGEPFTYSELCSLGRRHGLDEATHRAADKTIQRLRKKGLITFTRIGRDCVWTKAAGATP